jgi:hypothetical protein
LTVDRQIKVPVRKVPMSPDSCEFGFGSRLLNQARNLRGKSGIVDSPREPQQREIVLPNGLWRIRQSRYVKDYVLPKHLLNQKKEKARDFVQQVDAFLRLGEQKTILLPFGVEPRDLVI